MSSACPRLSSRNRMTPLPQKRAASAGRCLVLSQGAAESRSQESPTDFFCPRPKLPARRHPQVLQRTANVPGRKALKRDYVCYWSFGGGAASGGEPYLEAGEP